MCVWVVTGDAFSPSTTVRSPPCSVSPHVRMESVLGSAWEVHASSCPPSWDLWSPARAVSQNQDLEDSGFFEMGDCATSDCAATKAPDLSVSGDQAQARLPAQEKMGSAAAATATSRDGASRERRGTLRRFQGFEFPGE